MSNESNSQCQFLSDEDRRICGRRSVACTRCGEDTQLCQEHTEGLCAECFEEPDPRERPMSDAGKFLFELGMDLNRVYLAGMKAGRK